MKKFKHNVWLMPVTFALAACGGSGGSSNDIDDDSETPEAASYEEQVIDAQTSGTYTYLNLDTGETVAESGEWHMAFSRTNIQLNGGGSGSGNVAGALAVAQDDFYTAAGEPDVNVFLNATASSELEHLADSFPEPDEWQPDAATTAFGSDWYIYDFTTHIISPNPDNGWLVRSGEGNSYARVRVTGLDYSADPITFRIDLTVQAADTTQLTTDQTFSGTIPASGGEACYDFDIDQAIPCTGTTWDLKLDLQPRALSLVSNSGPNGDGDGAVLGPVAWSDLSTYTSATTDTSGTSLERAYTPDQTAGIFSDSSWYAYNLEGAHKLWPNYRVYLVNTDTTGDTSTVYAVQVINYYGEDGNSGQPVIRWKAVTLSGGEN
ncbi:HmuY family protein [Marinobacter sp. M1N3S26]|uniref:HmuY family protein n=1 Tax=unclassified Marinobacter TaxID=83889 RepID=UPI00387B021A